MKGTVPVRTKVPSDPGVVKARKPRDREDHPGAVLPKSRRWRDLGGTGCARYSARGVRSHYLCARATGVVKRKYPSLEGRFFYGEK
jgi:hypothetical protein